MTLAPNYFSQPNLDAGSDFNQEINKMKRKRK